MYNLNEFESSMSNHLMNLVRKIKIIKTEVVARESGLKEDLAMDAINEILVRLEK